MSERDEPTRFERVRWDEVDGSTGFRSIERSTLIAGVVVLATLYLYDAYVAHVYLVGTWKVERIDWVFLLGVVVCLAYGVVPALERRASTRRVLRRLLSRPATRFAGGYLAIFVFAGLLGPFLLGTPDFQFAHRYHPPAMFIADVTPPQCLGGWVQGEGINRLCHGSWTYPLGTNHRGHPMGHLVVSGARVALYVAVFAAAFVVPLATAVGVVAGMRGGLVDDLLMSYVDVQLCLPAIVLYFVGYMYWNASLLLLLVTFGLLSWGGIARLVRSEVLQRREDGYVLVARSLGASRPYIAKRHVLPNVTNTLVPAIFQLLALLVLVEAGVAFLGFHEVDVYSWGSTIAEGVNSPDHATDTVWWVSTWPGIALTLTLVSLKLVGDGLRDALDPRGDG